MIKDRYPETNGKKPPRKNVTVVYTRKNNCTLNETRNNKDKNNCTLNETRYSKDKNNCTLLMKHETTRKKR